ncbi:reductive dehalogenase [Winogradskyella sp.]|uniref:reductive dehalogenase n=1 Tax=Winogradskyella sp. TaxID=1883156 RepID=UPI002614D6B1|nr:reductive dehalogenase [Winogradskyella sp.]
MNKEKKINQSKNVTRRDFFKIGAVGAALGLTSVSKATENTMANVIDKATDSAVFNELDEEPFDFKPGFEYKRFDEINTFQSTGPMRRDEKVIPKMIKFIWPGFDNNQPGYRQVDWALSKAGQSLKFKMKSLEGKWEQDRFDFTILDMKPSDMEDDSKEKPDILKILEGNYVYPEKAPFQTKQEATDAIKRAARLYGADLVGITRRDERFDYKAFFDPKNGRRDWNDIPFEPKTVIVMAFEMDYEAMTAAPTHVADGATGDGYSQMHKTSYQMAVFMKCLGYQAIASNNDVGLSIPYAIKAGLGELGRHGLLITYQYGPRIRLAKIYTDFDFVEYDKPVEFGVQEFCKRCMRCADACPANAITKALEPTYEPEFEDEGNWFVNPGIKKYYNNHKKCFDFWVENGNGCSSCISVCPYNKPDFWHHKLVDKISAMLPGPVHSFMREMDKIFGYGDTYDEKAIKKFWSSRNRKYLGHK